MNETENAEEWWKIQTKHGDTWSTSYSRKTFYSLAEAIIGMGQANARNSTVKRRIVRITPMAL